MLLRIYNHTQKDNSYPSKQRQAVRGRATYSNLHIY